MIEEGNGLLWRMGHPINLMIKNSPFPWEKAVIIKWESEQDSTLTRNISDLIQISTYPLENKMF